MKLTLGKQAAVWCADGILLFLALFGAVTSFLTAFQIGVLVWPLLGACFLFALLGLVVFSLPKYRLIPVVLWVGVLLWVMWRNREGLTLTVLALVEILGRIFAQKIGMGLVGPEFGASTPFYAMGHEAVWSAFTLLFILVVALLAVWLGWAVVQRKSFWLPFLVTFPFLLAPLSITITPAWFPLIALLLFWCLSLLRRLPGRRDPYGGARVVLLLLLPAVLLLNGLRLALPESGYDQNPWARNLRLEAIEKLSRLGSSVTAGGFSSGYVGGSVEVDLAQAGPLRYTGRPVLRVESETTGHIYLRGFSSATYTEKGWEQLGEEDYVAMREGWEATVPSPSFLSTAENMTIAVPGMGNGFQPLNFPAQADSGGVSHRFSIESVGAATPYVFTPYQLATTPDRMTGGEFVGDAYLARSMGVWRFVLYAKDRVNPETTPPLSGPAGEAENAYRNFAYYHYTQVPEHLQEMLNRVTEDMVSQEDRAGRIVYGGGLPGASLYRLDTAKLVADYLAELAEYDAETPRTPAGEDFVEYFLTESHRGYCMHFASAATLMLRYLGVPARYVTGYTADVKAGQTVDVPDDNAHAWVEVYIDGYGWQPVEVTPGFSGAFPWEENTPEPTPSHSPPPSQSAPPTPTPQPPSPTPEQSGGTATSGRAIDWRPALVVLVLGALIGLLVLRRSWVIKRRRARFEQTDANRAVVAMYLYDLKLLSRHPKEKMDGGVHDLAEKATFSRHTLTAEERGRVLKYTEALVRRTDALPGLWKRVFYRYILCLH